MIKKRIVGLIIMIVAAVSVYSLGQDIVKQKTKKIYVSEQQDIELDGDIICVGNQMSGLLIDFSKTLFLILKSSIEEVNDYASGKKSDIGKVERTDRYAKKVKIKDKIEDCMEKISSLLAELNSLVGTLVE